MSSKDSKKSKGIGLGGSIMKKFRNKGNHQSGSTTSASENAQSDLQSSLDNLQQSSNQTTNVAPASRTAVQSNLVNSEAQSVNSMHVNVDLVSGSPNINVDSASNAHSHILIGKFDDEEDDDENLTNKEISAISQIYSTVGETFVNAARVAALLNSMIENSHGLNELLMYFAIEQYKIEVSQCVWDELGQSTVLYFMHEIYSTFIHKDSPLLITNTWKSIEPKITDYTEALNAFENAKPYLETVLNSRLCTARIQAESGLDTFVLKHLDRKLNPNKATELELLERTTKEVGGKLWKRLDEFDKSKAILSDTIKERDQLRINLECQLNGLITIYRYFKCIYSDNNSGSGLITPSGTIAAGLNRIFTGVGKNNIFVNMKREKTDVELKGFFNKETQDKKPNKEIDEIHQCSLLWADTLIQCGFCRKILCGANPQGFICHICEENYHRHCIKGDRSCMKNKRRPTKLVASESNARSNSLRSNIDDASISMKKTANNDLEDRFQQTKTIKNSENLQSKHESITLSTASNSTTDGVDCDAEKSIIEQVPMCSTGFSNYVHKDETDTSSNGCSKGMQRATRAFSIVHANTDLVQMRNKSNILSHPSMMKSVLESTINKSFDEQKLEAHEVFEKNYSHLNIVKGSEEYIYFCAKLEFYLLFENYKNALNIINNNWNIKWPERRKDHFQNMSLDRLKPSYELFKDLINCVKKSIQKEDIVGLPNATLEWIERDDQKQWKELTQNMIELCYTIQLKKVYENAFECVDLQDVLNFEVKKKSLKVLLESLRNFMLHPPIIIPRVIEKSEKMIKKYKEDENNNQELIDRANDEINQWNRLNDYFKATNNYANQSITTQINYVNSGIIGNAFNRKEWSEKLPGESLFLDYYLNFPQNIIKLKIRDHFFVNVKFSQNNTEIKKKAPLIFFPSNNEYPMLILLFDSGIIFLMSETARLPEKEEDRRYLLRLIPSIDNKYQSLFPIMKLVGHIANNISEQIMTLMERNVARWISVKFSSTDESVRFNEFVNSHMERMPSQNSIRSASMPYTGNPNAPIKSMSAETKFEASTPKLELQLSIIDESSTADLSSVAQNHPEEQKQPMHLKDQLKKISRLSEEALLRITNDVNEQQTATLLTKQIGLASNLIRLALDQVSLRSNVELTETGDNPSDGERSEKTPNQLLTDVPALNFEESIDKTIHMMIDGQESIQEFRAKHLADQLIQRVISSAVDVIKSSQVSADNPHENPDEIS